MNNSNSPSTLKTSLVIILIIAGVFGLVMIGLVSYVGRLGDPPRPPPDQATIIGAREPTIQALVESTGIVTTGNGTVALAFDAFRARLWVANALYNTVQAIDPATGATGAPINVGQYPYALAIDGTRLWIDFAEGDIVQYLIPPK
jgi:YVTN family beta-propeller protein